MSGNLGHLLSRLGESGASGRRPRMLEATVVAVNDELGGTSVLLGGVRILGLRSRPASFVPAVNQRVRIEAVGTDHTIVGNYDGP